MVLIHGLDSRFGEDPNVGTCTLKLGNGVGHPCFYVFDHASHLESYNTQDITSDYGSGVANTSPVESLNAPQGVTVRRDILVA